MSASGVPPVKLQGSLGPTVWTLSVSVSSLSPQTRRMEGWLWSPFPRPRPAPPWQLCLAQLHSLNQLLHPQGACRVGTPHPPPGGGWAELYRAGPSPGQHWAATWSWHSGASLCRGATRDSAVWAFLRVSCPSRRHPSAQSSALFCSEPFASTSAIRQWKTITICDFFPPVDEICIISQFGKRSSSGQGLLLLEPGVKERWLFNISPS